MYALNGAALDNPALGWVLRGPSRPLSSYSRALRNLDATGRDGVTAGLGGTMGAPIVPLVVQTPREHLDALLALVSEDPLMLSLTATPEREVLVELVGFDPEGYGDADAFVDVTIPLRLPSVWWRDNVESTSPVVNLASASVNVSVFPGSSGPIGDSLVRVKGSCSGLVVTAGRTWFSYGIAVETGTYLRVDCDSGRAWVTATDTWSGGVEVTDKIDVFEVDNSLVIRPTRVDGDPTDRVGILTVATTARSGAQIQVRGKGSYGFAEA